MKIDKTLRDSYHRQFELALLIEQEFSQLRGLMDPHWHYTSRIKSEESYAQKIEAGLFRNNLDLEDFFACTIVVSNAREIAEAVDFVEKHCGIRYRRPKDSKFTKSIPTDFRFDDLRLYVTLNPVITGRRPINDVIFEIQIKTFLKHAWGIATHDLTYKTDEVSWAKLRLSAQILAILEHAELSIEQFNTIIDAPSLAKDNPDFAQTSIIIAIFKDNWEDASLPKDLVRLSQTTSAALAYLDVTLKQLNRYIKLEREALNGKLPLDLSPFNAILQIVFKYHNINPERLSRLGSMRIMISKSVSIPFSYDQFKQTSIYFY